MDRFLRSLTLVLLLVLLFGAPYATFLLQCLRYTAANAGYPLSDTLIQLTTGWKELLLAIGILLVLLRTALTRSLPMRLTWVDGVLIGSALYGVIVGTTLTRSIEATVFGFRYDYAVFLYYLLARSVARSRDEIAATARVFVLAALPILFFGIAQATMLPRTYMERFGYAWGAPLVTGNPLPPFHEVVVAGRVFVRAMSTFPGPNSLAMYLVTLIFLVACTGAGWRQRWARTPLLILSVATLALTYSRGHVTSLFGALVIGLVSWYLYRRLRHREVNPKVAAVGVTGLLAVAGVVFTVGTLWIGTLALPASQFLGIFVRPDSSAAHREVRLAAWEGLRERPLGHGLGTAGLATTNTGGTVFNPESWFLSLGYELGWPGLFLALAAIAAVLTLLFHMERDLADPEDRRWLAYFGFGFLAIVLGANFLPCWFEVGSLTWWVLFGWFVADYQRTLPR